MSDIRKKRLTNETKIFFKLEINLFILREIIKAYCSWKYTDQDNFLLYLTINNSSVF